MGLEEFWFVLIAVLWGGYFLLEGFDFGVGMLLPVLPRDERERGLMFESIGPVWDGNEVWLVVAAGATPVTSRELIVRLREAGLRRPKHLSPAREED